MRTRKNKKYLKKYRNKTKKYGGVARRPASVPAPAQVITRSGRQPKKPDTFAKEQGDQQKKEAEQRQSKAATRATKAKPTITKTRKTKVGRWGSIKYNTLMPIIEQYNKNKKAKSDGAYMRPIKIKTKLDRALTTGLAKEHTNAFAERPIRTTYFPEFMNKYVPKNVQDIYSKINVRLNMSNTPLTDKGIATIKNDLKKLKLDENSDNLAVLKNSPVYTHNKEKLQLLLEEAYQDKDKTFLQDF